MSLPSTESHGLFVQVQQDQDVARLAVSGELDIVNVDLLHDLLGAVTAAPPRAITIDLAGLAFVSAQGIGVMAGAAARANEAGCTLSVTNPTPFVRHLLDISGEEGLLRVDPVDGKSIAALPFPALAGRRERTEHRVFLAVIDIQQGRAETYCSCGWRCAPRSYASAWRDAQLHLSNLSSPPSRACA